MKKKIVHTIKLENQNAFFLQLEFDWKKMSQDKIQ